MTHQAYNINSDEPPQQYLKCLFLKRSSYKTAVKSPGDSCVSSAGFFIENMLFDAAVIQSNAVKHCNIHFGEQLLKVKTKETLKHAKQQWDTCHNFKDWSRKSLHRQKVIVSGLSICIFYYIYSIQNLTLDRVSK